LYIKGGYDLSHFSKKLQNMLVINCWVLKNPIPKFPGFAGKVWGKRRRKRVATEFNYYPYTVVASFAGILESFFAAPPLSFCDG